MLGCRNRQPPPPPQVGVALSLPPLTSLLVSTILCFLFSAFVIKGQIFKVKKIEGHTQGITLCLKDHVLVCIESHLSLMFSTISFFWWGTSLVDWFSEISAGLVYFT